jgi:hypothetical protein
MHEPWTHLILRAVTSRHCRHLRRNIAVSVATTADATSAITIAATATATVAPLLPVQSFVHLPALSSSACSRRLPSSLPCDCRRSLASHRPPLPLSTMVGCCLSIPSADGGLVPSSAPSIHWTRPTLPRRHSKNALPGLRSCGRCDDCPCAHERPISAIPFARRMYNWGNVPEGWEGMHAFVRCDFHCIGHGSGVIFW